MPDPLRGKWQYNNKDWVKKYINEAKEKINNQSKINKLIMFIC